MPTTKKGRPVQRQATSLLAIARYGTIVSLTALLLTACGSGKWGFPYRQDIQQGNWVTSQDIAKLREGMSREQVKFILGTPTLQNVFRDNRWDYPYYNKPGYGTPENRKFTVWFEGDSLVRWSGDDQPSVQPFQQERNDADEAE